MNRILTSVMTLIMTLSIVTVSAYALFSDQATVSGIDFNTSSVDLQVSDDGSNFVDNFDANLSITGAYPGFGEDNSQLAPFFVKNFSSDISLDVTAQLTAATGWNDNDLKNYVEVAVIEAGDTVDTSDYKTLAAWNAGAQDLPGTALAPGATGSYVVYVRLPSTAPTSLQNKSLTDITFTLTGTQVTP